MALEVSQVLWLLVRSGGTGKSILNSNCPVTGQFSLSFLQENAAALIVTSAQIARIEPHYHMGFRLPHGVNPARRSIGPVP